MMADNYPAVGMLAAPGAAHKMCRVCTRRFCYNPLYLWPDYCPTCIRSTSRRRNAASVDRRSLVPSPGGLLPGGEAEPPVISQIAGASSAEDTTT